MSLFQSSRFGIAVLCLFASFALVACGSDSDGGDGEEGTSTGALIGTVQGVTSDSSVSEVEVVVSGETYTANEQGWFTVPNVEPGERVTVEFRKDGFVETQRVVTVRQGRATFLDTRMFQRGASQQLDASQGGQVTGDSNAGIDLPGGSLVTQDGSSFSGMANISVTNIDPSTFEARLATPGDFTGIPQSSDEASRLETFGMVNVDLEDQDGNDLDVDGNATVQIPAPQALQSDPPQEVPLWRYDEGQGRWVEEGTATWDEQSNCYIGDADQGGYWNADMTFQSACVTGRVVNPEGEPAPGGIEIIAEGVSYIGDARAWTDSDGTFQVDVMASGDNRSAAAQITAQGGGLYLDNPVAVDPTPSELASSGNCEDIGDLELSYPIGRMVLGWGENPSDLDSHFTGPSASSDGRFHISYMNTSNDQAFLDTDDTSSYGPEVVSLLQDQPGTYVYSVHNYSGEGSHPIADSGANVQIYFPNEIRSFSVADADVSLSGDAAKSVWRVFRFNIDEAGNVSDVRPLMEVVDDTSEAYDPQE